MKNTLFVSTFLLLASLFSPLAQAETYICVIGGKPYYTTQKTGSQCYVSALNGTATTPNTVITAPTIQALGASEPSAQTASVPQEINDEINRIWNKAEYGSFDDTIILPPIPKPVAEPNQQAVKSKTSVRHQPKNKTRTQTAKVVAPPPKRPVLTRRQVLQKEIDREKSALRTTRTQLTAAQKSGNATAITRLNRLIYDRQQNLSALEAEMRK